MLTETERSRNAPQAPVPAVGAVVFKDDAVLLVKRGNPPAKGYWAIPGGRIALGETLQQAAEREIFEETGVVIRANSPVLTFDVIERDDHGVVSFHYVIVDLDAQYVRGEPGAADDAMDARWVSETELSMLPVSPRTRLLLFETYAFGAPPSKRERGT